MKLSKISEFSLHVHLILIGTTKISHLRSSTVIRMRQKTFKYEIIHMNYRAKQLASLIRRQCDSARHIAVREFKVDEAVWLSRTYYDEVDCMDDKRSFPGVHFLISSGCFNLASVLKLLTASPSIKSLCGATPLELSRLAPLVPPHSLQVYVRKVSN